MDESKCGCARTSLQTRFYAFLISFLKQLLRMDEDVDIFRPTLTLPEVLDIGRQGGRDMGLSFDKVKFERLAYLIGYCSDRRLQRNDRRTVLALFISARTSEAVDVDDTVKGVALAHNREPAGPQIGSEKSLVWRPYEAPRSQLAAVRMSDNEATPTPPLR